MHDALCTCVTACAGSQDSEEGNAWDKADVLVRSEGDVRAGAGQLAQ